jgi:hypothetical protein
MPPVSDDKEREKAHDETQGSEQAHDDRLHERNLGAIRDTWQGAGWLPPPGWAHFFTVVVDNQFRCQSGRPKPERRFSSRLASPHAMPGGSEFVAPAL